MKRVYSALTVLLFAFGFYQYYTNPSQKIQMGSDDSQNFNKDANDKLASKSKAAKKQQGRKVATAKTKSVILKYKNRQVMGRFKNDINDLPITNAINPKWIDTTYSNLRAQLNLGTTKQFKVSITELKSVVFVKHGIGKYAEHVMVSIKKDGGRARTYEALVDSQTGSILQTWNKTRAEKRESIQVSIQGRGFAGTKL